MVGAYVTVSENYRDYGDAASGPLAPGKCGQVTKQDNSDIPFMVRDGVLSPTDRRMYGSILLSASMKGTGVGNLHSVALSCCCRHSGYS